MLNGKDCLWKGQVKDGKPHGLGVLTNNFSEYMKNEKQQRYSLARELSDGSKDSAIMKTMAELYDSEEEVEPDQDYYYMEGT